MAQDLEQIIGLLNEMNATNNANAKSFDNLLSKISAKLDFSDENSGINLINAFANELKKSIDEKYSLTVDKFENIEKALKAVYQSQNEFVKNSDMRELFDIFTKNVNNIYTEAKQEKSILTSIEGRLAELINNKSDKEDIMRTIALLRKDFENINYSYKNLIEDVNTNLKSIISGIIRLDPLRSSDNVRSQVEIMFNSINSMVVQLNDLDAKNIKLEQILDKVATNEDLKITSAMLESLIEKTDLIEQKVNTLSQEEFGSLNKKTDEIVLDAQSLKQNLAKVVQDIEKMPDTRLLEESLKGLYSRIENLSTDIDNSNVKGDIFDVNSKLVSFKDELITVKNIVKDLNDVLSDKISETLDSVFGKNSNSSKSEIIEVLQTIPTKDDIEAIFTKSHNVLIESLLDKTNSLEQILNDSEFKQQTDGINFVSTSSETLTRKTENIETSLMSISDYIQGNLPVDIDYIKQQLDFIKSVVAKSKEITQNVIPSDLNDDSLTNAYIEKVKSLNPDDSELIEKLTGIEDALVNYNTHSENRYLKLLDKISEFKENIGLVTKNSDATQNSLSELSDVKSAILKLSENFKSGMLTASENTNSSQEKEYNDLISFIDKKIKILYSDLDNLSSSYQNRIMQGFAYNTELFEEKTGAILNYIEELKLSNSNDKTIIDNIDKVASGLSDIKEELDLINTDIVSGYGENTENLLNEIQSIKTIVEKLQFEDYIKDITSKIDTIHSLVNKNENDNDLENLYIRVKENIVNSEAKLKDFILSDTDSLILKIDSLRDYVESSLKSIVPPNPKKTKELYDFKSDIEKFKKEQEKQISNLSSDITKKHNELKSMISVALNHDNIIAAIDNLKYSINKKFKKFEGQDATEGEVPDVDESEYIQVLQELRQDYRHFAGIIENLSDKNSDIENIVNLLSDKIDTIASTESLPNNFGYEKTGSEDDSSFDILRALDYLKEDIDTIKNNISEIIDLEQQETAPVINTDEITNSINSKLESILEPIKENWLKEIKSYLNTRNLDSVIQSINNKLDYMALGSNEAEILDEMNKTLDDKISSKIKALNAKLDVIASGEELDILNDLSNAVDDVDYKISNLQSKLDNIPKNTATNSEIEHSDNSQFFENINNSLKEVD